MKTGGHMQELRRVRSGLLKENESMATMHVSIIIVISIRMC